MHDEICARTAIYLYRRRGHHDFVSLVVACKEPAALGFHFYAAPCCGLCLDSRVLVYVGNARACDTVCRMVARGPGLRRLLDRREHSGLRADGPPDWLFGSIRPAYVWSI